MRRISLSTVFVIGIFAGSPFFVLADNPTPQEIRFFETRIRPLLANRCFKCHGSKRQKGDLRLDSLAAINKGGVSGVSVVVSGHPEKSLLIKAVGHRHELKMPPTKKLSTQEIADLTRWVKLGAFFPGAVVSKTGNKDKHWAFQPPAESAIPPVTNADWAQTPIDRFILAALEAKGLRPAGPADKRTLIRRATFDLTGLPPTPHEVADFLSDQSSRAFAKVVERLLASPHYGERWGRHWLDVARYADSNGLDENVAFGNAWRYRDYVVASFNNDKPYDRFLLEQIAGDLLEPGGKAVNSPKRRAHLIATGFLSLGPKVLAEVDAKKMEMDILDEQIDTLGRAVMGLTLGCARCHNHKFDPISMEDYYGLAGIFQSTKTMEHFKKVARWHENSIAGAVDLKRKAEYDQLIAKKNESIQALIDSAKQKLEKPLPKNPEKRFSKEVKEKLKRLRDELTQLKKSAPELPTALGVTEGKVTDAKILRRGDHLTPTKVTPRRFPSALTGGEQTPIGTKQSGRLELARWLIRNDHPLTSRVMVNRIWRWHFGRGIVKTTDNFGRLGERPSNQPLLDWLAHRFVANGWSIKKMHRLIMLSSTYQMNSRFDKESAKTDPENRLHWRFNARRLEAEAIRDSLLAVSGLLDRQMGGSLLHVKNRGYLFDHTSKDLTKYDSLRRSIYLPVVRNHLYDVFQLYDATDATVSNGNRATTTVATQALFFLNSELAAKAARRLAETLLAEKDLDETGRLRLLYLKAYGRPPNQRESARARATLADFQDALKATEPDMQRRKLRAWTWLCHAIIAANEFVFVS